MYKTINEAHGLAPADVKRVKDLIDMFEDKDIKRILKFLVKSNVEVDKTQDVTKMKKENKHHMKITKKILERFISEETESLLAELDFDTGTMAAQARGEREVTPAERPRPAGAPKARKTMVNVASYGDGAQMVRPSVKDIMQVVNRDPMWGEYQLAGFDAIQSKLGEDVQQMMDALSEMAMGWIINFGSHQDEYADGTGKATQTFENMKKDFSLFLAKCVSSGMVNPGLARAHKDATRIMMDARIRDHGQK